MGCLIQLINDQVQHISTDNDGLGLPDRDHSIFC
jgi:hypothetical protein